jgi:ribonuclease HI
MFTNNWGITPIMMWSWKGLIRGLDMAKHQGITSLLVEGDSLLIITTLKHLREGSNPEKISTNWRLSHGWTQVASLIQHFQVLIPAQVRRSANSVADYLENAGVQQRSQMSRWYLGDPTDHTTWKEAMRLNEIDMR